MDREEILKRYQETISLLYYRNPKFSYHGDFITNEDGKVAFRLKYYDIFGLGYKKIFKYVDTKEKAVEYFIYMAQNRFF